MTLYRVNLIIVCTVWKGRSFIYEVLRHKARHK